MMKNAKIILLILIGVLLFCNFGCGGGGGGVDSQGNYEPEDEQVDEAVESLVAKIFTTSSDGSPMVFDYAPKIESLDMGGAADSQKLDFVKYISSKDLNSDDEYVTTVHLEENVKYVIKYSHGGRTLPNSVLGVGITDPEGNEMILDIAPSEFTESDDDIIPVESSDEEIEAWLDRLIEIGEIPPASRDELLKELEKAYDDSGVSFDYYVSADVAAIPEENPCIIMYMFTAPMTGDYEFAVSELLFLSDDVEAETDGTGEIDGTLMEGINKNPEIPFEFRIYAAEAAHSVSDGEEIELTSRDIIDFQRMFLDFATEFNENGLPISFENDESYVEGSDVETSDAVLINGRWVMLTRRQIAARRRQQQREKEERERRANYPVVDAVINNVPYDEVFAEGAGFHAHSGLRATTNIIDDSSFKKNAIQDFSLPTPETGDAITLNENYSFKTIATQEEHDRAQEVDAMSNFALLREALGYTKRQDYARLGLDHIKVLSVRYELIESKPRVPDPKTFKVHEVGIQDIKEEGVNFFIKEYGDYFVAGYTWGNRYDATIEIMVEPGKSYYQGPKYTRKEERLVWDAWRYRYVEEDVPIYVNNPSLVFQDASQYVEDILKNVRINAVAERDTGKSDDEAKKTVEKLLNEIENNFHDVTIRVTHSNKTGSGSDLSFSLRDFVNDLAAFIKSAKTTPRSQYGKLYVTLMRFRELEDLKPYNIPEVITTPKSLYNAIRNLNKKIFLTRCYYNALMAIPASNLKSGATIQGQWKQEFETDLVSGMNNGLNNICSSEARVNEYYRKFDALYEKYKALAERYNFYRYFVLVSRRSGSPSWSDSEYDKDRSWSVGFQNYDKSSFVKKDIEAGSFYNHHHQEPWYKGPRGAVFSKNLGDERVIWLRTGHTNTNHCKGRDTNGRTIGKNSYHWTYTGASSRRCEVYLHIKTIKMPSSLYPFAGLD